jgi:pyruvate-ferredoxin/flavodoxin oxidoreductase
MFGRKSIRKSYAHKGEAVVAKNLAAVDGGLAGLHAVKIPISVTSTFDKPPIVPLGAPAFVQSFTAMAMSMEHRSRWG